MKRVRIALLVAMVAVLALNAFGVAAQDIPQVSIQISNEGVVVPSEVPEGAVTVLFENSAEFPVVGEVVRLNEGETVEAYSAEMMAAEDPDAAFLSRPLMGGTMVMPGATATVTYVFTPGNYVFLNLAGEMPEFHGFSVADAEGEGAAAPTADVDIKLMDFAFSLPIEMAAGEQIWRIYNEGEQWHELGMIRLDENMTLMDFHHLLMSEEEGAPPDFIWLPMMPGEEAWVTMNLEPGTYGIACFLPDIMGEGQPHLMEGMVQIITVTEAEAE